MAAPLKGSKGEIGELETRDGSDCQNVALPEVVVGSPHSLTVSRTEDAILDDDDGTSISSTKSVEMKMLSDDDDDFNPDLPAEYKAPVEANPEKELVAVEAKHNIDEGNCEKKVPESTEKSSRKVLRPQNPRLVSKLL